MFVGDDSPIGGQEESMIFIDSPQFVQSKEAGLHEDLVQAGFQLTSL